MKSIQNIAIAVLALLAIFLFIKLQFPSDEGEQGAVDAVADYGAAGDGIADDTSKLQAALDSGKMVYLPPGTFRVTANLDLRSNGGFIGTDRSVIVLDGDYRLQGNDIQHVTLSNLTIRREMEANTATEASIQLFYSSDIQLDHLKIVDHKSLSPAIWVRGSFVDLTEHTDSFNIRITDNDIVNYQRVAPGGVNGAGDDYGVKGSGISVAHSKNVFISNNRVVEAERYFEPSSTVVNFQGAGIEVISSLYGTVVDNTVQYAGQGIDIGGGHNMTGPRLTADNGFRGSQWITVTRNEVEDIYGVGIKIVNGSSYNRVIDNTVTRSGLVGIWLAPGSSAKEDKSVVKGNVVQDNRVVDTGSGPGEHAWAVPGSKRNTGIAIEQATDMITRPTLNVIFRNTVTDGNQIMTYGISDHGVLSEPEPYNSYQNYFFENSVSGTTVKDFHISPSNESLQ